jgi:hypothetical protein
MLGGLYYGQAVTGGFPGISGVKRILRGVMRLLNGMRTMRRERT